MGKLSLVHLFCKFYDGCKPGEETRELSALLISWAITATRGQRFSRALVIEPVMTCIEYHCNNIVNPDHKAIKFSARPRHKSLKCSISCLLRAKSRRRKLRLWVTLAASLAAENWDEWRQECDIGKTADVKHTSLRSSTLFSPHPP